MRIIIIIIIIIRMNATAVWLALLLRIRVVLGSNLGPETDHYEVLRGIPQSL
jgi:hypothetical protein